jgi:hypothetical protein
MATCPQCGREVGIVTYTCTVPGCLQQRFCCPACMHEHLGRHIRERDETIEQLTKFAVWAAQYAFDPIGHSFVPKQYEEYLAMSRWYKNKFGPLGEQHE